MYCAKMLKYYDKITCLVSAIYGVFSRHFLKKNDNKTPCFTLENLKCLIEMIMMAFGKVS